jgi:beta-hydroxylase
VIHYSFAALALIYIGSFAYFYHRYRDRLPLHKYLSNHVFFLAPVNLLFSGLTTGQQSAVLEPKSVPGLDKIKANYPLIRREAKVLLDSGVLQRPPAQDQPGYNTFEQGGWRLYMLKWYTKECNQTAVESCPATCALIDSIPAVRSAMFTVLPPGAKLGRHHDPVASSLRYHLGLLTPNSKKCALTLDGVEHAWFDGEELLFDQTYLHSAFNDTDTTRVILFCDVEKTRLKGVIKRFADWLDYRVVAKMTGTNDGKLSWISWAYKPIFKLRSYVKVHVKQRNMVAYNIIKFGTLAILILFPYLLLTWLF